MAKQQFEIGNAKGLSLLCDQMGLDSFTTLDGWRVVVTCEPQDLIQLGMRLERMNQADANKRVTLGELEARGLI